MRFATNENVAAAEEAIKDVYAFQQSRIDEPLKKALAQNPTEIVIVTGKYGLDDEFINTVMTLRGKNPVKIHTVSLGKSASPDTLRKLAEKTGARFKEVSGAALAEYAS
jgi:RNA-binding protein YhbY